MEPSESIAKHTLLLSRIVSREVREHSNCTRGPDGFIDPDSCYVPFWYTKTGVIVKWSLFLGLSTIFGLYLILGYLHAKRRITKGQPPMAYHRWLVARNDLARVDPRYPYPHPHPQTTTVFHPYATSQQQQPYGNYGMYPVPPPVYDPDAPRPPMYPGPPPLAMGMVPDGATKVDPMQQAPPVVPTPPTMPRTDGNERDEEYEAPAGPPPSAQSQQPIRQQGTGGMNPFRD
ncbi:hypothetical protein B0T20DRAFT_268918 [Sordaria brevicollis]|uniref:Uncharacterized protein n=1 Tax=Sordaria brevicollis TaxID=83679 RepID=A0AAE0UAA5_SORBR|nr:hypothetical protein B0T20DRAFT_268918 [Sordaria brevicollis]